MKEDSLLTNRNDKLTLILLTGLVATLSMWLIYMTSWGDKWWFLDTVDDFLILGSVDDAYRYFITSGAFHHLDYYNWSYIFPWQLLVDGTLSWLVNHNLVVLRIIHGVLYITAMSVMCVTIMKVTQNRLLAFSSFLLLTLMPACLFVSISFYGEAWMAMLTALLTYAFVYQRHWLMVVLTGLCSITRPEGAWLAGFIALSFLTQKQYQKAAFSLTPIGIYLTWVCVSVGWHNFVHWRVVFSDVRLQAHSSLIESTMDPLSGIRTYGYLFFTPVLLAFFNRKTYRYWPLIGAVIYWMAHWMNDAWIGHGKMEIRYFVPLTPVLVLLWALGLEPCMSFLQRTFGRWTAFCAGISTLLATLVSFSLQQAQINYFLTNLYHGNWVTWQQIEYGIGVSNPNYRQVTHKLLALIDRATSPLSPDRVDTLLIPSSSSWLFYHLNADTLPSDVTLGYVPLFDQARTPLNPLRDVYAQFNSGTRYARYDFYPPRPDARLALYIGYIPGVVPTRVILDALPIYLFAYQSHQ